MNAIRRRKLFPDLLVLCAHTVTCYRFTRQLSHSQQVTFESFKVQEPPDARDVYVCITDPDVPGLIPGTPRFCEK
jgi:hypothetical protein